MTLTVLLILCISNLVSSTCKSMIRIILQL